MECAHRPCVFLDLSRDGGYSLPSDPLITQHNDTFCRALIFSHELYHKQEFLAQRHKREPLTAQAVTTLMGLWVARTTVGTSYLLILQQEMGIICSQWTMTLEKTDCLMLFTKVFEFLSKSNLTK